MMCLSHLAQSLVHISCAYSTSTLFSKYLFRKHWKYADLKAKVIVNYTIYQKKKKIPEQFQNFFIKQVPRTDYI